MGVKPPRENPSKQVPKCHRDEVIAHVDCNSVLWRNAADVFLAGWASHHFADSKDDDTSRNHPYGTARAGHAMIPGECRKAYSHGCDDHSHDHGSEAMEASHQE